MALRRMREAMDGGGKDKWSCWRWEARRVIGKE